MKRYCKIIFYLVIAVMILSLSGCGGSSSSSNSSSSNTDKLMVISSPVLKTGESYRLYRGANVTVNDSSYNPMYYVAPIAGSDTLTMNLEFSDSISNDLPFAITHDDNGTEVVVFYYNPKGSEKDLTTEYGSVIRTGGSQQQLKYSGLTVTGAAVDIETSDEIVIVLNGSTASIQGGTSIPSYNYVWHADPDHRDEYYTLGSGTTEYTESQMLENITTNNGLYINRDIRYMPDTLSFTGTAKNDNETEYAAYYSSAVQAEVAAELGTGFEGPYIFATLPMSMGGMPGGQMPGGDMPSGPGGQMPPGDRPSRPAEVVSAVSNSDVAAFSTMTHSAEDAYDNPVLHITEPGTYRLQGTWNGQIWIEAGKTEDDKVALILDGVTVTCGVAPALVFKEVYECGPSDEADVISFDVGGNLFNSAGINAGALVVIADNSTNSFTGTNVYRMLKAQKKKDSVTTIDGTDVSQQKKRYKMDGAFYSFMSMVIAAESNSASGTLNITSTTYEGLNTEMHLLIDSGKINVTAEDDGINVNEDTSVFTMDGGTLTVIAKNGDGIDSNGYIVINGGTVDITCAQDSDQLNAQAEGPIDADLGVYMSDSVKYSHRAYSGSSQQQPSEQEPSQQEPSEQEQETTSYTTTKTPLTLTDDDENVIMTIRYTNPEKDTDASTRGIASSGSVFTLTHKVNNFSGVGY